MFFKKGDFKILATLAIPLLLSGAIESSLGFISNIFLAHLGPLALGAGSLIVWFFATLMVIMWGVFTAVSILTANYHGANNNEAIGLVLRDSTILAIALTVPTSLLIYHLSPILIVLGQKAFVVARAFPYLHALSWSVLPDFLSLALLQFIIGLGKTRTNLIFTILWVPINIAFDYIFVFGKLGIQPLGIAGLGWGATASFSLLTLFLIIYLSVNSYYKKYLISFWQKSKPTYLIELLKVGLPLGLMFCVEIACFFTISLFMGNISATALEANQITIQYMGFFASLMFAIAQAITVRMGNQIGAKQINNANRAGYAGLILTFIYGLIVASVYLVLPHQLIALDFNTKKVNPNMMDLTIKLFSVAAVFQIIESIRISLFGALRALKETKFTLISSIVGFWGAGIGMGYIFYHVLKFGPSSYWWALSLGAIFNVALLSWRFRYKMRQYIK